MSLKPFVWLFVTTTLLSMAPTAQRLHAATRDSSPAPAVRSDDRPPEPASIPVAGGGMLAAEARLTQAGDGIRIGVLAKRGVDQCLEQWGPTAAYLSSQIPTATFVIVPLEFDQIFKAVEHRQIDFVLANSSFYVEMEAYYGARRIATLYNLQSDGTARDVFAGVVFARADRHDLNRLADLKGNICMAVDERSLGGWHMQWREMVAEGFDPHREFAALRYGGTHDAVVYAVLNGNVDVGCVRSDTLERMALERKIRLSDFKLIMVHSSCDDDVAYLHSTRHYPEWPFVKAPHTDDRLAREVAVALMRMPPDSPAAIAGRCAGWTIPQNYEPVRECLRVLHLPPYQDYGNVTPAAMWRQYRLWILGSGAMSLLILVGLTYVARLRSHLAQSLAAREARERSRAFLQSVVDGFPDVLIVVNRDHTIALANRAAMARAGDRDAAASGMKCHAIGCCNQDIGEGDHPSCPFDRIFETGGHVVTEQIQRDDAGRETHLKVIGAPIIDENGNVTHVIESCRDITERKLAESNLRSSEEKYRRIFENSIVGFFQSTPEGRFISVNMAFARMLHYDSPEDLISDITDISTQYYVDPGERDRYQQILQRDGKIDGFAFRAKCRDGEWIWVTNSTRAYFDDDGHPTHYEGVVSDITANRRDQQALVESEQRFRELFDNMRAGVAIYDSLDDGAHFTVRDMNRSGLHIFGKRKAEVVGRDVQTVFPGITASGLLDTFRRVRRSAVSESHPASPYADGDLKLWIECYVSRLASGELVAIYEDITARRESERTRETLERQIRQAQKMEAIGTLAGGIAHDFNNILSPLIGYTEMLQMDIPADSPMQKYVDQVLKAALRSRDLVAQILSFSRQGDQEARPLRIQPIVKEVLKLLRSSIPTTIDIQAVVDRDCGLVIADPTQVHQIVMNLATNAYHAMESTGGVLRVSLEMVQLKGPMPIDGHLLPGEYVVLTVADTGPGIPGDLLDKVFDPYFTTKAKGKGTGLGLSVVRGIVRHCRGDIRVRSAPGEGTEMQVYFPVIESTATEADEHVDSPVRGGNESLLLVDDEEGVVKMMTLLLERLNYTVTSRSGSLDALAAFRARPDAYDLVITDMTMPNMTGVQLAAEIRRIRPDVPIVICTGFSDQIDKAKCQRLGLQGLVKKPVITRVIADVIRRALDGEAPGEPDGSAPDGRSADSPLAGIRRQGPAQ